jgi:hypothetical protein
MRIAPYAVACLVFAVTSRLGMDILKFGDGDAWCRFSGFFNR